MVAWVENGGREGATSMVAENGIVIVLAVSNGIYRLEEITDDQVNFLPFPLLLLLLPFFQSRTRDLIPCRVGR